MSNAFLDRTRSFPPAAAIAFVEQRLEPAKPYQEARLFASATVSLRTSHRRKTQAFRSARASRCRKTMMSYGWNEITKSSPSLRISTFRLSGRLMTPVSANIRAPHCLARFPTAPIGRARARIIQDCALRTGVMKRQQSSTRFPSAKRFKFIYLRLRF